MSNWVRNQIIFKGKGASSLITRLLTFDENGDIMFDFNKILPMPIDLIDTKAKECYWCEKNWGTKWNACETKFIKANENECEIYFETNLSCPFSIITRLSQTYPSLSISGQYSSENIGINCGMYYTDQKQINYVKFKDLSNIAYETYIDMWGMPKGLAFNKEKNNYEWFD